MGADFQHADAREGDNRAVNARGSLSVGRAMRRRAARNPCEGGKELAPSCSFTFRGGKGAV
eukprot:1576551-Pyramimonas_sp.AAC.1